MNNVNDFFSQLDILDSISKSVIQVDVLIRQGNMVSAYRQGVQIIKDIESDTSKKEFYWFIKILSRSLVKIRKGEQIDALNDIKSLSDSIKNERKRKIDEFKEYLSKKIS